jgi:uncharacterized protein YbjT (DUF2867 family)
MTEADGRPSVVTGGNALVTTVFGASGYVGTQLVPRLVAAGHRVRAVARQRRVLEARGWRGVELLEADALNPPTLPAALAGCRVAYYLVHSMAAGRDFGRLDREAARNFAAAAEMAGVERIVYLGGLVPPGAESEHLVSRAQSGECLRSGKVPVIEIRAGIIVGPGSAAYEVMRDLVYHLPLMITPKWVQSRSSPIALDNLLYYLERIADEPAAVGRIFDAGGPEYLSYEQMMCIFGEVIGRRPIIVRVPLLSPRLSSYWLGLVTSVPASIARALIGGLRHDIPAHDEPLRALIPQRLRPFREAVLDSLAAERSHRVPGRWTEGAFPHRAYRHDHAFYAKRASATVTSTASAIRLWRVVTSIGGSNRYYTMNALWWLRELLDWLVGGPGFSRGRRDPVDLRVGDAIDYWTVLALEPERRLTLHFGMKAPGSGILEFELEPLPGDGTVLTETAYWHPRGVWGLLYWYALVPFHLFIFRAMTRAIARKAEHDGGARADSSEP